MFEFTVAKLVYKHTDVLSHQQWVVEEYPDKAKRFVEQLPEGEPLEMVAIPGGTFVMGSPQKEAKRYMNESPQHIVTVPPFFMGRYPITQSQWRSVVEGSEAIEQELNPKPSFFKGDNRPVEQVIWQEAIEFCQRLSTLTGKSYRLPSEAEWEYACRAVKNEQSSKLNKELNIEDWNNRFHEVFHFGYTITRDVANYYQQMSLEDISKKEIFKGTNNINAFEYANAFGLVDMHGNVWEWCLDCWHKNYYGAPNNGSAWVEGTQEQYVLRGGSWNFTTDYCRSAYRAYVSPTSRELSFGFRVVCTI
ncbi:MAG: formylglycine-generating enzyme family protein [Spirulina sp. SIO3F2]|nr:formylglycine-generating enzyme family protein [Spirulina sp. SIO3F2]